MTGIAFAVNVLLLLRRIGLVQYSTVQLDICQNLIKKLLSITFLLSYSLLLLLLSDIFLYMLRTKPSTLSVVSEYKDKINITS